MWSVENPEERDELQVDGLKESIAFIISVIQEEATIMSPERIILGGISQGCATAIHALIFSGIQLGGFIGFCSWLPFEKKICEITNASLESKLSAYQAGLFQLAPANQGSSQTKFNTLSKTPFGTPVFLSHSRDDEVVPIRNLEILSQSLKGLGMSVEKKTYDSGGHWISEPEGVDNVVIFLKLVSLKDPGLAS